MVRSRNSVNKRNLMLRRICDKWLKITSKNETENTIKKLRKTNITRANVRSKCFLFMKLRLLAHFSCLHSLRLRTLHTDMILRVSVFIQPLQNSFLHTTAFTILIAFSFKNAYFFMAFAYRPYRTIKKQ